MRARSQNQAIFGSSANDSILGGLDIGDGERKCVRDVVETGESVGTVSSAEMVMAALFLFQWSDSAAD